MTTSSSPPSSRGLDTMILVYSLLQGHRHAGEASMSSRPYGSQAGWFTSALVLVEAKNILTKVYGVCARGRAAKLVQFATGPVVVLDLDKDSVGAALQLADSLGLDLTDAVLLHHSQQQAAAALATEDHQLAQACARLGISAVSPLDLALRQQVAAWKPPICRRKDWRAGAATRSRLAVADPFSGGRGILVKNGRRHPSALNWAVSSRE